MASRVILIDPNKVNDLVRPEDLFIYVSLEVEKKPRTIISIDSDPYTPTVINRDVTNQKISFINGTKEPGRDEKVLTTNYTRLTTVLRDGNDQPDSESFGIRNISIDFDTAYTPLIKIDFIDIHGSTLFELGNQSKYSLFFDLPYPLFKLTVKGYYGPSVTYCLHLLKFNAKFNSDTGNFEISCNFIGYTFAFLSDMLLGYLRAAVETPRGKALFEAERAKNPELKTINELVVLLSLIQKELTKTASTNHEVKVLESGKNIKAIYEEYETQLKELVNLISNDKIVASSRRKTGNNFGVDTYLYILNGYSSIDEVNKLIENKIESLNTLAVRSNENISDTIFHLPEDINLEMTIKMFEKNDTNLLNDSQKRRYKGQSIGDEVDVDISTLLTENTKYVFFDILPIYEKITNQKTNIEEHIRKASKNVASVVDSNLIKTIGFKPTIYNFINIFTTHVEVFIKLIGEVSIAAMNSSYRAGQLAGLANTRLDVTPISYKANEFYPWPEYNEETEDGVVETWIGKRIGPIPETIFVEELLQGFLKSAIADNTVIELDESPNSHTPSNIFDIKFLKDNTNNPYNELLSDSKSFNGSVEQVILGSAIRLANYKQGGLGLAVGYTDYYTNVYELLGKFEAQQLFESLINLDYKKNTINSLINFEAANIQNQILKTKDILTNGDENLALPSGQNNAFKYSEILKGYEYSYISDEYLDYDDSITIRGYLPNTLELSKYKRFYGDNKKLLPLSKVKEEFEIDNSKFPQYNGYGNNINALNNFTNDEFSGATYPFFDDIDDGSMFMGVYNLDDFNFNYIYPSFDSFISKTTLKFDGVEVEIGNPTTDTPQYVGPKLYSTLKYRKTNLLNSLLRVNDNRYIIYDSEVGNYVQGLVVSSSIFWYGDGLLSNFWYSSCPIYYHKDTSEYNVSDTVSGIYKRANILEPEWFIDNPSGAFSPMCCPIHDIVVNKPSLISNKYTTVSDEVVGLPDNNNVFDPNITQTLEALDLTRYGAGVYNYSPQAVEEWLKSNSTRFSKSNFNSLTEWENEIKGVYNLNNAFKISTTYANPDNLIGLNKIAITAAQNGLSNTQENKAISIPTLCTFGRNKVQLFGSEFYFEQQQNPNYEDAVRVRAFLFLNMLPIFINFRNNGTDLNIPKDLNMLLEGPGLQEIPVSMILWIGAKIWFKNTPSANVYFTNPNGDELIPALSNKPTRNTNWISDSGTVPLVNNGTFSDDTSNFDDLPKSFKNYCVSAFKNWTKVDDFYPLYSWGWIRQKFELMDFDNITNVQSARTTWMSKWINFKYTSDYVKNNYFCFSSSGDNENPYITFQPYIDTRSNFNKIKLNTSSTGNIPPELRTQLRYDYYCFINHKDADYNDAIWGFLGNRMVLAKRMGNLFSIGEGSVDTYIPAFLSDSEFNQYYTGFFQELNELLKTPIVNESKEDELKKKVFGTIDNDLIRLNIYRQISAIYTKWIGGSQNNLNIPCISDKDKNNKEIKLIDRFKFIDRAYRDIGQKLVINPYQINQYLVNNYNQSFYDLVGSKILANNNMDFIPLPTYINFRDPKEIASMFETYTINKDGGFRNIGPSFVCVYVGQVSQHLDLGYRADYINDGIDFLEDANGGVITGAKDFDSGDDNEDKIPVFVVNYSDPKQSIFKDVRLDQMEFSETDESLQLIDNLTNSRQQFLGQNLFNIYSVRSYSSEITMLGNLTVQPFMYFQLNNIPMFHGGYMIVKVSHEIEAHHVTTKFKGVRVKRVRTPLIDEELLYLSIINEFTNNLDNVSLFEGSVLRNDFDGVNNPEKVCNGCSTLTVDEVYPRTTKYLSGPDIPLIEVENEPTVLINKTTLNLVPFEETLVTANEYISEAIIMINKISPNISLEHKKLVITSALAIARGEQGSGDKIKGFNNNLTGVESSGFKVFKSGDVNGKVQLSEGGTNILKDYYSFSSIGVGLVPLLTSIMNRNILAIKDGATEWGWRYFRDWNGYGARRKSSYVDDCTSVSNLTANYNWAKNKVDGYTF